mgnify:CR=1 FL=1
MLLKALDLLRRLGWGIINFIYNLIDTLFDVLKSLNAYNIIDSVADNSLFSNFHKGIIAIAIIAAMYRIGCIALDGHM